MKNYWNIENTYAKLPKIYYTKINFKPVKKPSLVIFNDKLGKDLGLNIEKFKTKKGIDILAGNQLGEDSIPLAQAYGGHQFGHFNMLGDGRTMLLGEQISPQGERYDIQLKGSGRTAYSRGGDGRAGLGPMLREYIVSEALHNLGIATTRSLALVETGEKIVRRTLLPGGILTRVTSSHIRVGTFQYAATWGSKKELKKLADYTIKRHYPDLIDKENPYLGLVEEVVKRQAKLIASWQGLGFVHGVMNTDNMTISGEGIDYGPCAFMDSYNEKTVFSSIDREGRYAYGNQPAMGEWNLIRFAESLLSLIDDDQGEAIKLAQGAIEKFEKTYSENWLRLMANKIGIEKIRKEDKALIDEMLYLMEKHKVDYTNFFLDLTFHRLDRENFDQWYKKWEKRLEFEEKSREEIKALMKKSNPALIPRNHLLEEALEAAVKEENYEKAYRLIDALSEPFNHSKDYGEYAKTPKSLTPYITYCGT